MESGLWTPMDLPTAAKREGGSYFDDEMHTKEETATAMRMDVQRLLNHLNTRPDHTVYVASAESRDQLRKVFNWWKREGALGHNPNIRIDYGIVEGAIRVGDGR